MSLSAQAAPSVITGGTAIDIYEDQFGTFNGTIEYDSSAGTVMFVPYLTGASWGTFELFSDGKWTYMFPEELVGWQRFQKLDDGETIPLDAAHQLYEVDGVRTLFILGVNMIGVNDAPVITSNGGEASAAINFAENGTGLVTTVVASDIEGHAVTYGLSGADAALFTLNETTGALSFNSAPDFETRADADANGVYEITVTASDGKLSDSQALSITVTDVNESRELVPQDGGRFADVLFGKPDTRDIIAGNNGNDTIYGEEFDDVLLGNRDNDLLYGGAGDDVLFGGQQNDVLYGGSNSDRISGDKGNDTLYGDGGSEDFRGADVFVFKAGFGRDVIMDFQLGVDQIEFSTRVFRNFDQLTQRMQQVGDDVVITQGVNQIRIEDVLLADLTASHFLFVA